MSLTVTDVSVTIAVVSVIVAVVSVTLAKVSVILALVVDKTAPIEESEKGIEPSPGRQRSQISSLPAPNDVVYPATKYPPSVNKYAVPEVCRIE